MAHTCSECRYLELDHETKNGKYWCSFKGGYRYADEQECWGYCRADGRSDSVAESARGYSQDSQKSTIECFITTALCKILSMPDDNKYLMTLRKFRKEYLQKNEEGLKILIKYDFVGPQISERLSQDNGKFNFAYILFENYIKPIVNLLDENKYEDAIAKYTEMTNKLIEFYQIDDTVNVSVNDVNPELTGHGKVCLKTKMA